MSKRKRYKQLKILSKMIDIFEDDNENKDKFYIFLKKEIQNEIKKVNPVKEKQLFDKCKPFYKKICHILKNGVKDGEGGLLMKYIEQKKYEEAIKMYRLLKEWIVNHEFRNTTLNKERTLLQNMIPCLYFDIFDGSLEDKYKVNDSYLEFWNTFVDDKKWVRKKREEFRKIFRYYICHDGKFVLTNLNQKSKALSFKRPEKGTEIDKFIEGGSTLIKFLRFLMLGNTSSVSPLESYSSDKKNYKKHIYISVFSINKKLYVYVGKAKESTRYRWGYGSGHFENVFHYLVRGGSFNLPKQITDLWTLYFGSEHQVICTLETNVYGILDDLEKAYQYLFEWNKKKLGITNYLHDTLKANSFDELEEKYKIPYIRLNKQLNEYFSSHKKSKSFS